MRDAAGMGDQTRRAFLGVAAALPAAGVLAGCGGGPGAAAGRAAAGGKAGAGGKVAAARPAESTLAGDRTWWIKNLGAEHAIEGYAGRASVLPGERVQLYVSTSAPSFRVIAFRLGAYRGALARRVWESGEVTGIRQRAAGFDAATRMVSCSWEPSLSLDTAGWPEGSYVLRLDASTGAQRFVPLTVRSARTAGKVVIKNAVATWQAYNLWGGYSLYNGPGGGAADRSLVVSLDRPYDHQGAELLMVFERKLICLAEGLGLPLAYVTSADIDADPHLLDGARALITPGHDEYWSPAERANVTAARDKGMNIAFFGANAMFRRVRYEAAGRRVVCYKGDFTSDPMYGKRNSLVTSDFREPPDPDPESSLTGTLYESNPTTADYVVVSPDSWLFAGTGVRKGSRFRGLVGDEYDRVNPVYPVPRPIEVVAHSPLTCRGVHSYADSAYYTHPGGAGVFNSGTMRWVQSLAEPIGSYIKPECTALTRKVTENVLRAFAEGPAAARYPARDNLVATREWPGDPIAARHDLWPPVVS